MKKSLIAGFASRFSIAYAVVVGAIFTKEIRNHRNVTSETLKGLRGSILLLGILFGALILGRIADELGRKRSLVYSTIIRVIGMVLNPYVPNYSLALLFRFIAGFGIGGSMAATTSYVIERSRKEVRGRNVVLMESMWARGSTVAAIMGILTSHGLTRSEAFIISGVIGIIALILISISEETYVRLAKRGNEEAKRIAESMGFVIKDSKVSVKELLRTFMKYTLLLRVAWAIVGFAYYYRLYTIRSVLASLNVSSSSAFVKMAISLASQLLGYLYAYLLVDRIGRRPLLIASYILAALSLPIYFVAPTIAGAAFVMFNVGVWGTIYTYTPEIYPADVRATALGSAVAMARIGALIGPLVGIRALAHGLRLRVAILAIVHAVGAVFILPLPETKGKIIG